MENTAVELPSGGLILRRAPLTEMLDPNRLLGATMTVAIYFGELAFAIVLAIGLLIASTLRPVIAIVLVCCGFAAWTLAEYLTHRYVLHAVSSVQHRRHHARPREAIDKIFWQIWLRPALWFLPPRRGG